MFRRLQLILLFAGVFGLLAFTGGSARALPNALTLQVSNPYSAQVAADTPACVIRIRSISASSSDPNFTGVQISVNGKTRAYVSNFFETSTNLSEEMLGEGLQVVCGTPGSGGVAGEGKTYTVEISAIVHGGSPVNDTTNVTCPFYVSKTYLPNIRR